MKTRFATFHWCVLLFFCLFFTRLVLTESISFQFFFVPFDLYLRLEAIFVCLFSLCAFNISLKRVYFSRFDLYFSLCLQSKCPCCTRKCLCTFILCVSALISIWNRRKIFFECRLFFFWNKFTFARIFAQIRILILNGFEWCFFLLSYIWWYDIKFCVYFLALAVFNCNAKTFIWAQVCTWVYWDFKHR